MEKLTSLFSSTFLHRKLENKHLYAAKTSYVYQKRYIFWFKNPSTCCRLNKNEQSRSSAADTEPSPPETPATIKLENNKSSGQEFQSKSNQMNVTITRELSLSCKPIRRSRFIKKCTSVNSEVLTTVFTMKSSFGVASQLRSGVD